jgi:dihydrofolate reductase
MTTQPSPPLKKYMPEISVISAFSLNLAIGYEKKLPWHIPSDLKRFKQLTLNQTVIMGRETYESIGKPLPQRNNIVVSSRIKEIPQAQVASSLKEALKLTKTETAFVIGGERLYREAIPLAQNLYLTLVLKETQGDTFFPFFDIIPSEWELLEQNLVQEDLPICFTHLRRK